MQEMKGDRGPGTGFERQGRCPAPQPAFQSGRDVFAGGHFAQLCGGIVEHPKDLVVVLAFGLTGLVFFADGFYFFVTAPGPARLRTPSSTNRLRWRVALLVAARCGPLGLGPVGHGQWQGWRPFTRPGGRSGVQGSFLLARL